MLSTGYVVVLSDVCTSRSLAVQPTARSETLHEGSLWPIVIIEIAVWAPPDGQSDSYDDSSE